MKRLVNSWTLAVAALAGIAVFGAVLLLQTASFHRAVIALAESDIREKTELAAEVLSDAFRTNDTNALHRFGDTRRREGIRVTVVERDGTVVYDTETATANHAAREEIRQAFTGESGFALRRSATLGVYQLYGAQRVGNRVIRLAVPYAGVLAPLRLARNGFILAGVVGAGAVLLIFFFSRRLTSRLAEQTRALASAQANEAFRRDFTANVSHELKTPLTAILGAAEMAGDGTGLSDEERIELMGIIQEQCGRLNALVKDVLSLAQIEREAEEARTSFVPVPMDRVVEAAFAVETPRAERSGTELRLVRNDHAHVSGDPHLLEQVVVNFVENALRYSGSDRIEIASAIHGRHLVLTVTDFGIGIPSEHLAHLFERFYRVDKARSRSLGGTGLGLAIVKHIARLHGGDVAVDSTQGVRTTFTVRLPCIAKPAPKRACTFQAETA